MFILLHKHTEWKRFLTTTSSFCIFMQFLVAGGRGLRAPSSHNQH